ncbi:MAG: phage antirepressor KilAC domain-containing protein [Bacteroidales bacterium]|nr:phage antirepressor KilAC domain-containing protein [Bacteroidales bacterium]
MENLNLFNYNGFPVSFRSKDTEVMLNATQMASAFRKRPGKWLELPSTEQFLLRLEAIRKTDRLKLIQTINGVGTWMHEDVALEFARWLSPSFAIWCNDRIKELLKFKATAIHPEDLLNPDFIINLATELKREREEKERFAQTAMLQEKELIKAAPMVHYYNNVLQSESLISTNVIAKDMGMSAVTLNRILHGQKIIYKSGRTWVLYHEYQNKGYTRSKTHTFTDNEGNLKTAVTTYWTERGRAFIQYMVGNGFKKSDEKAHSA